jgi:hypothetical protein
MPLIDLKTDLKSLKYGHDRPSGGDSGQPYIQNDINNPTNILGQDDGFIRGGATGALNASLIDKKRIESFFKNEPQGTLFKYRQVALQFSNPRLEVKKGAGALISDLFKGNVTGNVENALGTITGGILEPTRIYNLGINTIAQVPVNAIGGHIIRHGALPIQSDESKYESVVKYNNKDHNRLVDLKDKFNLGDRETSSVSTLDRILGFVSNAAQSVGLNIPGIQPKQLVIDDYLGGPGSTYGVVGTIINRTTFTEDKELNKSAVENYKYAGATRNKKTSEHENVKYDYNLLGKGDKAIYNYEDGIPVQQNVIERGVFNISDIDPIDNYRNPTLRTYASLKNNINQQKSIQNPQNAFFSGSSPSTVGYVNQFGIYVNTSDGTKIDNTKGDYSIKDIGKIGYQNSYGDIITLNYNKWSDIARENRVGSGRKDSINLTPIFTRSSYWYNNSITIEKTEHNIRDLVKFAIQAVDTDNNFDQNPFGSSDFMIFRAYLTSFSDGVDADWTDIKYAGRGNKFYIYNGFNRKIQIGFKVAALSAEEMQPMYSKLNYLMSSLMPDYNGVLMRGGLHRITVGNYLDAQLGKIDSISYTIPNDSPWEISLDEPEGGSKQLILPHIIEVSMNFTPIGAETGAVDSKGNNVSSNKIEEKTKETSFLAQNTTGADVGTIQYYSKFKLPTPNPSSYYTNKFIKPTLPTNEDALNDLTSPAVVGD